MNKLFDAAVVAALLMASIPDLPQPALPFDLPAQMVEAPVGDAHGDRPC